MPRQQLPYHDLLVVNKTTITLFPGKKTLATFHILRSSCKAATLVDSNSPMSWLSSGWRGHNKRRYQHKMRMRSNGLAPVYKERAKRKLDGRRCVTKCGLKKFQGNHAPARTRHLRPLRFSPLPFHTNRWALLVTMPSHQLLDAFSLLSSMNHSSSLVGHVWLSTRAIGMA